ncbi:MAG: acyl-CoA dehydrogenase family protein [Planctomycetota bacterium]|jgi:alkylation response protein AidB-like acyl-CoA dehydrogenase
MFGLSKEEEKIRLEAREFCEREIKPLAEEIDRTHELPKSVLKKLGAQGYLSVLVPKEYGGSDMGNVALSLIQMEIGRVCASTAVLTSIQNSLVCGCLKQFGTEEQKRACLPDLVSGEWMGAYSLTEPQSGSDAASLKTTAVRDGDCYVLNGAKTFVTAGSIATLMGVFVRTDPDAPKTKGISALIVEPGTKGLAVGKPEDKMGVRGSPTNQVFFDDCRVPVKNLLGVENEGFRIALSLLDGGRIGIASQAIGITQACLEASVAYAKVHKRKGRPLGFTQSVQWKIADMAAELEAARLLVLHAARMREAGVPHTKEASMAKLFAAEVANRHAPQALQILGMQGTFSDFAVERHYRDAKITEIYEGTSEVQRIVISRNLLS